VHARTNEYRAAFTVVGLPTGWRISESRVLEQSVIDAAPTPQTPRILSVPELPPGEDL
jgi:hypothetical protein